MNDQFPNPPASDNPADPVLNFNPNPNLAQTTNPVPVQAPEPVSQATDTVPVTPVKQVPSQPQAKIQNTDKPIHSPASIPTANPEH